MHQHWQKESVPVAAAAASVKLVLAVLDVSHVCSAKMFWQFDILKLCFDMLLFSVQGKFCERQVSLEADGNVHSQK